MITCKRCKNPFKTYAKVDGKKICLSARTYCLTCSPYKVKTKITYSGLLKAGEKWCNKCQKTHPIDSFYKNTKRYNGVDSVCKDCRKGTSNQARKLFKDECLRYKGGKCEICGYNKCHRALHFHHIDPKQKDFQIGRRDKQIPLNPFIKTELDKCILLCSNCHMETHDE